MGTNWPNALCAPEADLFISVSDNNSIRRSTDGGLTWSVSTSTPFSSNIYTINGVLLNGSTLAFGYTASSGLEDHEAIYEKLKKSHAVEVRYDPNDPASSVLSHGMHRSIHFMLAFAIIWLTIAIGLTVFWWLGWPDDHGITQNLKVH